MNPWNLSYNLIGWSVAITCSIIIVLVISVGIRLIIEAWKGRNYLSERSSVSNRKNILMERADKISSTRYAGAVDEAHKREAFMEGVKWASKERKTL